MYRYTNEEGVVYIKSNGTLHMLQWVEKEDEIDTVYIFQLTRNKQVIFNVTVISKSIKDDCDNPAALYKKTVTCDDTIMETVIDRFKEITGLDL